MMVLVAHFSAATCGQLVLGAVLNTRQILRTHVHGPSSAVLVPNIVRVRCVWRAAQPYCVRVLSCGKGNSGEDYVGDYFAQGEENDKPKFHKKGSDSNHHFYFSRGEWNLSPGGGTVNYDVKANDAGWLPESGWGGYGTCKDEDRTPPKVKIFQVRCQRCRALLGCHPAQYSGRVPPALLCPPPRRNAVLCAAPFACRPNCCGLIDSAVQASEHIRQCWA